MDPTLGGIVNQFDPRLVPLLGWVVYAVKVLTDWVKTATTLPKWAPPAIAFGSAVVLLLLLMLAIGIGITGQLAAQAVMLAVIAAGLAIGATAMQARTKPSAEAEAERMRLPVKHETCGGTAFFALIAPRDRDLLNPTTQAIHADGSPVIESPVLCGVCGRQIEYAAGLNGKWVAV
jgi:hypothetical protein